MIMFKKKKEEPILPFEMEEPPWKIKQEKRDTEKFQLQFFYSNKKQDIIEVYNIAINRCNPEQLQELIDNRMAYIDCCGEEYDAKLEDMKMQWEKEDKEENEQKQKYLEELEMGWSASTINRMREASK